MVELQKIATEQRNPNTTHIDTLSTLEMVRLINQEDQKVALAVAQVAPEIARAIDVITRQLSQGGRLFYAGCGTSGRLGILDAVECPPTYSTDPELVQAIIAGGYPAIFRAVEGAEDDFDLGRRDLQERGFASQDVLVGLAASGRTPYVLGAMGYARELGAAVIAVTCCPGSDGGHRNRTHPRTGGHHRFHPDEKRHRPEDGAEYALHRYHDQAGQGLRQPDGGREAVQRKADPPLRHHRPGGGGM